MATYLDPAVRGLRGEVNLLRGAIDLVDHSSAKAIRNLNYQASRVEQHASETLTRMLADPRRGLVGTPTQSEDRFCQVDTVVGLMGQISVAKTQIRAMAKGIHAEGSLTYDVRESWAHWGVKNFVGKPIKAVAYDAPTAFVEKTGAINAITITALGAAAGYAYMTGDHQTALVVAGSGLLGRGVIHLGDKAFQGIKAKFA